jgi:hypothetical protein
MNMPGFNAETSLYKGKNAYYYKGKNAYYPASQRSDIGLSNSNILPQASSSYLVGCCNAGTAAQITKWIGENAGWCHIEYYLGTPCSGFGSCVDAATCDPLPIVGCNTCQRWY